MKTIDDPVLESRLIIRHNGHVIDQSYAFNQSVNKQCLEFYWGNIKKAFFAPEKLKMEVSVEEWLKGHELENGGHFELIKDGKVIEEFKI